MQRRDFSRSLLVTTAMTAVGLGTVTLHAQPAGLKEGSDFIRLKRTAPVDSPAGQIEVVEFFAYSCVHCYNFEPLLKDWMRQKPANVVIKRVPVGFNPAFEPMQRLYYTLEAMNLVETLHDKVFQAIHVDRQRLQTAEAITAWIAKQGVDQAKFTAAFNSFGVTGKVRRATQLQDAYEVEATPSLGVAGRYYVPGQAARTILVANTLIADLRKG